MLVNLMAEMSRFGVSIVDLADLLGRERRAIKNRLSGVVDITGDEIALIRDRYFPSCALDYLLSENPIPPRPQRRDPTNQTA